MDVNADDPASRAAAGTALGRQYLTWSRFPFYVIQRTADGTVVYLNDARYSGPSGRDGWAGLRIPLGPGTP